MSDLQIFNFESKTIRTHLDSENNPWWAAKDVCSVLGISKYRDAVSRLDDDEARPVCVDASQSSLVFISESGLYTLILRSNKDSAKKFRKWITSEVLPSLRKTGSYSVSQTEWRLARTEGKIVRKITTDIIKSFVEYAKSQGSQSAEMYYANFSKMVNASLLEIEGKKPTNLRDKLNVIQLHQLSIAETIITRSLVECISRQMFYKEIYQIAKSKIEQYSQTVGKSKIGQSERQLCGLLA